MSAELVGTKLGAYDLLDLLGEGGMGAVFKARETLLHRVVALKVIHKRHLGNRDIVDRFFREALLHANLNHPNIVTIYTAGMASGFPFIAMEYVEGSNLAEFLRSQGRLPVRSAVDFMHQAAGAIAVAHAAKIVHRDIKPQNILVDAYGTIKLMDFGIARRQSMTMAQLTKKGQVLGTPSYMAPEQIMGEKVDERSDIYSLGVMFYQLLTQRLPYEASTPMEMIHRALTEEFAPVRSLVPDVPDSVAKIIDKSLARDPKDRYPSVRNMKAVLDSCILELDLAGFLA